MPYIIRQFGGEFVVSRVMKGEEILFPSADIILEKGDKLLIVTPWRYIYRHTHEPISVAECKTMNCVVQAMCRTKDSWWKEQ